MATTKPQGGMGSGTPRQEFIRWMREAKSVQVLDLGEQHNLFTHQPQRMYQLVSAKGDILTITAEFAHEFGLRPTQYRQRLRADRGRDLFNDSQEGLF